MLQMWRTTVRRAQYTAAIWRNYHTIEATPREIFGRRYSVRERGQGRIPTVVYAVSDTAEGPTEGKRKQLLTTDAKEIRKLVESVSPELFDSTTFKLQVRAGNGSCLVLNEGNVLPVKLHIDPMTGHMVHLTLAWADEGHLKKYVPVVLKGKGTCPGLKKGGQLISRKSLRYLCPAESVPQKIEVDISKLDIGDKLLLKDIQVDSSLKLLSKNRTTPVCKILEGEKKKPVEADVTLKGKKEEKKKKPVEANASSEGKKGKKKPVEANASLEGKMKEKKKPVEANVSLEGKKEKPLKA